MIKNPEQETDNGQAISKQHKLDKARVKNQKRNQKQNIKTAKYKGLVSTGNTDTLYTLCWTKKHNNQMKTD